MPNRYDYAYDDEGNLTGKTERATGEATTFAYDYRNRLTGATTKTAGGIVMSESHYTYDVFDRVVGRDVNGQRLVTVYDGANPWADYDGAGQVAARYLYGGRADEILARWTPGGGQAWYLADKQGTIRDVINAAGAVIGSREYDTFGKIIAAAGAVDRFAFQGREWDATLALYQFRARWYDPGLRQFTSEDPLSFAAGDFNLKRFVGNAPTRYTDPSGMLSVVEKSALVGGILGAAVGAICALGEVVARDNWTTAELLDHVAMGAIRGGVLGAGVGAAAGLAAGGPAVVQAAAFGFGTGYQLGEGWNAGRRIGNDYQKGRLDLIFAETACLAAQVVSIPVGGAMLRSGTAPQAGNIDVILNSNNKFARYNERAPRDLFEFAKNEGIDVRQSLWIEIKLRWRGFYARSREIGVVESRYNSRKVELLEEVVHDAQKRFLRETLGEDAWRKSVSNNKPQIEIEAKRAILQHAQELELSPQDRTLLQERLQAYEEIRIYEIYKAMTPQQRSR